MTQPTADTAVDPKDIIAELERRDLERMIIENGDTPATRDAHRRLWDTNPACPDCGSRVHFECSS
jgi:hypothetical protein